jgi:hypothetical protein
MSRLKHILSGSPALRLHSRLILCAAAAWCFAFPLAHAQSLSGAVTLQIVAGEPKPSELNLSGHHNADVIPDADDRVALPVRFDRSEPRSFQVVLLATWGDSGFNELPLSFDPLDLGKRFVINLVNWQPEFPAEYSVSGLTAMSRGNCQRLRNSVSSLFGTYHVCRQIYERFHAKGHGEFLGALIAFKGWFDAAYRLSTVHRAATSFGRDPLIEDLARKLEDRARDDGNLQVRLASTGVQLGYYTGMLRELDNKDLQRYAEIRKVVDRPAGSSETFERAKVSLDIVEQRFGTISAQRGSEQVINGITLDHIKELSAAVNSKLPGG